MATKPSKTKTPKSDSVVARQDDGTIQITFTIPFDRVKTERAKVEKELAVGVDVPGFRKGKAPVEKALERIPENTVLEHTLQHILPQLLGKAMTEHKLKLAIYPKFELLKAKPDEDWEVRAVSAELPEVVLGDYKEKIAAEARTGSLWTPEKGDPKEAKLTNEQKQQVAIKALLENIKITIPWILIEEETNSRLSQLLERIERLGLQLDSYLASVGKTAENLRSEYEKQSKDTLSLDLILNKIAEEEKITVPEKHIEEAIAASSADRQLAEKLQTPEQRRILESILRKRATLDHLTTLVN
jgi:FKBP-type peptidyl-prolyl cis-trans isomerase (trigger factor)